MDTFPLVLDLYSRIFFHIVRWILYHDWLFPLYHQEEKEGSSFSFLPCPPNGGGGGGWKNKSSRLLLPWGERRISSGGPATDRLGIFPYFRAAAAGFLPRFPSANWSPLPSSLGFSAPVKILLPLYKAGTRAFPHFLCCRFDSRRRCFFIGGKLLAGKESGDRDRFNLMEWIGEKCDRDIFVRLVWRSAEAQYNSFFLNVA